MARYAIIESGIVTNIAESGSALVAWKPGSLSGWKRITAEDVQIGDTFDGTEYARSLPPLPDAKLAAWEQVKAKRDGAIDAGVEVPGIGTFDSDESSRINIIGAVVMAQIAIASSQPFAIKWTLADNSVAELNAAQMIAVGAAVGQHVAGVHMAAQTTRAAIEAAKDYAEIPRIDDLFTTAASP